MIFNLFLKNSFPKLSDFYLESKKKDELSHYSWMALAVNQRSFSGSLLAKELVLTPSAPAQYPTRSFILAETDKGINHRVHSGAKKIFSGDIENPEEIESTRFYFNEVIDTFIQRELAVFTESMNKSEISIRQLEGEEKSLEWLRVSFEILSKGVIESLTNSDYLFQATLFVGINPKDRPVNILREIRLIAFNLDMTFLLLEDKNLRVLVYNKKPGEEKESLSPALVGDFSYRKREMFDLFINLLSVISKGLHA